MDKWQIAARLLDAVSALNKAYFANAWTFSASIEYEEEFATQKYTITLMRGDRVRKVGWSKPQKGSSAVKDYDFMEYLENTVYAIEVYIAVESGEYRTWAFKPRVVVTKKARQQLPI